MNQTADNFMKRYGRRLVRLGSYSVLLRPRQVMACMLGIIGLLLFALWMLPQGQFDTPLSSFWHAVGNADVQRMIWQDIRLPRILTALLAGAMLGAAGAALQTLSRNGLADPGLVGIKEGAALAVVGMAVFAPDVAPAWRSVAGLAGGLTIALVVAMLARDMSKVRFILIGIGISWLLHGVIACFMTTADIRNVQTALIWLAGSLHAVSWETLQSMLFWAVAGLALLLIGARNIDTLILGRTTATSLGTNVSITSTLCFLASCILTSAAVAAVGSLGFVGLIAPHLARLTLGVRQASLLIGSILYGAGLVLLADSIGRLVFAPLQIPAGIVMALVGVPFLLVLLWQRRDQL